MWQQEIDRAASGNRDPQHIDAVDAADMRCDRSIDSNDIYDTMDKGLKQGLSELTRSLRGDPVNPAVRSLNEINTQITNF